MIRIGMKLFLCVLPVAALVSHSVCAEEESDRMTGKVLEIQGNSFLLETGRERLNVEIGRNQDASVMVEVGERVEVFGNRHTDDPSRFKAYEVTRRNGQSFDIVYPED